MHLETRPPRPPRARRLAHALPLLALALAAGCAHSYVVEERETPVHLWVTVPGALETGRTLDLLAYVGAEKAFEGPVRFAAGTPHVALPTLYLPAGTKQVSVVVDGGALSETTEVRIRQESWLQIVVRDRRVQIAHHEQEPRAALGTSEERPTTAIPKPSGR
jgi:hypothetical protein